MPGILRVSRCADDGPVEFGCTSQATGPFCRTSDGVHLAFSAVGSGPPLVKTANWLNHLEFDWQSPYGRRCSCGLPRDIASSGTTNAAPVSPIATFRISPSRRLSAISRLSWIRSGSIALRCSVCRRAHPSPSPRRSASRTRISTGVVRRLREGLAQAGQRERSGPRGGVDRSYPGRLGAENPAARQIFTSLIIADATREEMEW